MQALQWKNARTASLHTQKHRYAWLIIEQLVCLSMEYISTSSDPVTATHQPFTFAIQLSAHTTMVKVAIAGGTGGLGLHIVESIVEAGKHEVVVLSRKSTHPVLEKLGVSVISVSYDDPAALTKALGGVHTVISTISELDGDALTKPQLALLAAAVRAGVKRFAPSEFAARPNPDHPVELYRRRWAVTEAVMRSGLEYTIFEVGIFMNYFACGTAGIGHLYPFTYLFDVENCTATLLGDGSRYIVYTRAEDVGKFVAASLDLEKWPERSVMRGDRKRLNEILRLAEEVRGALYLLFLAVVEVNSCCRSEV